MQFLIIRLIRHNFDSNKLTVLDFPFLQTRCIIVSLIIIKHFVILITTHQQPRGLSTINIIIFTLLILSLSKVFNKHKFFFI